MAQHNADTTIESLSKQFKLKLDCANNYETTRDNLNSSEMSTASTQFLEKLSEVINSPTPDETLFRNRSTRGHETLLDNCQITLVENTIVLSSEEECDDYLQSRQQRDDLDQSNDDLEPRTSWKREIKREISSLQNELIEDLSVSIVEIDSSIDTTQNNNNDSRNKSYCSQNEDNYDGESGISEHFSEVNESYSCENDIVPNILPTASFLSSYKTTKDMNSSILNCETTSDLNKSNSASNSSYQTAKIDVSENILQHSNEQLSLLNKGAALDSSFQSDNYLREAANKSTNSASCTSFQTAKNELSNTNISGIATNLLNRSTNSATNSSFQTAANISRSALIRSISSATNSSFQTAANMSRNVLDGSTSTSSNTNLKTDANTSRNIQSIYDTEDSFEEATNEIIPSSAADSSFQRGAKYKRSTNTSRIGKVENFTLYKLNEMANSVSHSNYASSTTSDNEDPKETSNFCSAKIYSDGLDYPEDVDYATDEEHYTDSEDCNILKCRQITADSHKNLINYEHDTSDNYNNSNVSICDIQKSIQKAISNCDDDLGVAELDRSSMSAAEDQNLIFESRKSSPIEVPDINIDQFDESEFSVNNGFNDTLEEIERALRDGLDYTMPEDVIEDTPLKKSPRKQSIISASFLNHNNTAELGKSNVLFSAKKEEPFKVPETKLKSKLPTVKRTHITNTKSGMNFNDIVSPVRIYINNTPKPYLKQNMPNGKKINKFIQMPEVPKSNKENAVSVFPEVVYKGAKKKINSGISKDLLLPPSIKKLVKNTEVIKHQGRVNNRNIGDTTIHNKLMEADLTRYSFNNSKNPDISILIRKQDYIQ